MSDFTPLTVDGSIAARRARRVIAPDELEAIAESLHPGLFSLTDRSYGREFDNPVDFRPQHQKEVLDELREALLCADIDVEGANDDCEAPWV